MRTVNLHIAAAVCVLIMTLVGPAVGDTHYVSPGQSIQAAIDDANDGDEIEVSAGTYNEAINFNGKAVRLYSSGGPEVTTIDGTGNYHVVQCISGEGSNTVLDGFTITGGKAYGSSPDDYGGGMYNYQSSPTVTDCNFSGNSAKYGGGMYNSYNSNQMVSNCTFSANEAVTHGGGMFNNKSSPTVTNCNFIGNTTLLPLQGDGGGGMFNSESNPTVTNCNFSGNSAEVGGGIFNGNSSPTVTNCNFSGNTTEGGGGGMFNTQGSPTVTHCAFSGNSAAVGGGMLNYINSSPTVTCCTFSGNTSSNDGGGMHNATGSTPTVITCIFSDNSADDVGGGMHNYSSSPVVINCTLSGNSAMNGGGGMYNFNNSFTATNCIFWGNWSDEFFNNSSTPTITYSNVLGGHAGTGNIDADPCFVDAAAGNLRLKPDSPCIDAGDTTVVTFPLDLDGNPRAIDDPHTPNTGLSVYDSLNVVDMGAYEIDCEAIAGDNNCDGVVNFKDVAILCNNWLAGTEPEL